ncbi:hypothetical protein SYNPS1DRAFT_25047 [Syncephalis pseudoplumigaleata]|uniref:Macro domain-containing protein n=1 Tax=Syncephalis pseudoplumigaleata TaxID=1712513 RepID=A0A4P9YUB6_9FUNG|nr:hypothetical protein SYNPS1DRAFT_25047 [Syncephalis pseudoplumigaleata]|eukprot:RKP22992.1 hypothetical protein SYNPS1DRAFT_25047 [Syncephalis pseudoplumigaleata]
MDITALDVDAIVNATDTRLSALPVQASSASVGPLADARPERPRLPRDTSYQRVAFPCISTGTFCYPTLPATQVALGTVRRWIDEGENRDLVDRIVFCVFSRHFNELYVEQIPKYFPPTADTELESMAQQ